MLAFLSLPAVLLLIGLPNFHGLGIPGFGGKKHVQAAPADTLPPHWNTASRLALESQFVRSSLPPVGGPGALKLTTDPRTLTVTVDPDSGTISATSQVGDIAIAPVAFESMEQYAHELPSQTFKRQWAETNRQWIQTQSVVATAAVTDQGTSQGLSLKFPSPLPKKIQSFLGPGGPALTVSGSENIQLSGTSNWTNQQLGPLGRQNSLFPSLDMQQNLDIRLEGQLSDRIRVNLLQNSGVQIPLFNRLAINYKGDEDDVVQELDLGNTNLTLPGTQYVSYSGRNEGLFGVKSSLRAGPLDFTILASKQEGRSERASYAGGSSSQSQTLADLDYVKGAYFFLYDPNTPSLFIQDDSLSVYLDDARYDTNIGNEVRGRALLDPIIPDNSPDTVSVRGQFRKLYPGPDGDYEIMSDFYGPLYKVIRLKTPVSGEQRLAVTYKAQPVIGVKPGAGGSIEPIYGTPYWVGGESVVAQCAHSDPDTCDNELELRMKLLRAPASLMRPDVAGNYDTTLAITKTRELELKNIYLLAGQNIDLSTFKLVVRRGVDEPPVAFFRTAATRDTAIPYLEALGLDNFDESVGANTYGHDGRVDGTRGAINNSRLFVDPTSGTLFLYDLHPFAPRLNLPFDRGADSVLFRRARLNGPPDSANAANSAIYDKYVLQRSQDARYYIDVEFTAQRATGEINLGRGNIVEGSDVVTVNGVPLQRDRDYTIDYDLGKVTMKKQLGPTDQLAINYSYAPLFQQAGRTLIGSAFRMEGREKSFGGAFMYESQGAQDLRPRLGEEPSRSVIGDLNTEWTLHPQWLTRAVDMLPGVRTTMASDFHIQAEVGASLPNPNTRNEVYVDDMEGVRDAVPVPMGRDRWRLSSVPSLKVNGATKLINDVLFHHNAELHFYSPPSSVNEVDLKPTLTQAQGATNKHQVLALSVPRIPHSSQPGDSMWVGLTYPLDPNGLDLSRSQFIEVWVNDFNDRHDLVQKPRVRGHHVRLHIDLGVVSEDQQRSPDVPPNNALDTEDQIPRDGQLSVTSKNNEDTGVDGMLDDAEIANHTPIRDLVTANANDPNGDDFQNVIDEIDGKKLEDIDKRRFLFTNGTEGSKNVDPVPDTEDMNLNEALDKVEDYFEYSIDLGDSAQRYLETDVQRDFPGYPSVVPWNGWRRYRIPINDSLRVAFGVPDLTIARHVRVWLDGIVESDSTTAEVQRPLLMLGGLEIVGNRWQAVALTPGQQDSSTTMLLNTVNSVDNADVYQSPFDPGRTLNGSQDVTRREQSIALEFSNLAPDDTLEAFKTFSIDEDYSRYGNLTWYATGFDIAGFSPLADKLDYFVRFASDELGNNYYEYKAPVRTLSLPRAVQWERVELALTALSNLKLRPDFPTSGDILYRVAGPTPGDSIIIHGRPSFTRLRRISFGLINPPGGRRYESGALWFDELRAKDVAKDHGTAERILVNGNFANLIRYNATWDARSADFITVGQSRGLGTSTDALSLGGSIDVHRFFESTGIVLPVNVSYSRNTAKPRFTAGDDVVRLGALAAASETRTENRAYSTSYTRAWSTRSNPLLLYTLGGITGSYAYNESNGDSPTTVTSSTGTALGVNYGISPRTLLPIPLLFTKAKFYPLPERFFWNYSVTTSASQTFQRTQDGSGLIPTNALEGRTAFVTFGADTRPFDFLHHHFDAVRNLTLAPDLLEKAGPINFGRVVTWRQALDARWSPNRGPWLSPSFTWGSTYNQDNRPELSPDMSIRAIGNSQSLGANYTLPFDRFALAPVVARPPASDTTRGAHPTVTRPRISLRQLLSRLGAITTDGSWSRGSNYTRLTGTASPLYLLGLSTDPGISADSSGRMHAQFGNNSGIVTDWRGSARTRVLLTWDASLQFRANVSGHKNELNDVVTRSLQSQFPDFELDYGRIANVIQLSRIFNNPRLRTAYTRSQVNDYRDNTNVPSQISTSSSWQPLLSLDGDFKNQTRLGFKVERRITQRENFQFGHTVATDRNTDINLSLNRSYSRGQKVRILLKETTVRTNIALGLTAVYSKRSGETRQVDIPNSKPQFPANTDRLSINGTGSYSFSSNITGNVTLGFGQTRDLEREIIQRNVRLEVRAALTF